MNEPLRHQAHYGSAGVPSHGPAVLLGVGAKLQQYAGKPICGHTPALRSFSTAAMLCCMLYN